MSGNDTIDRRSVLRAAAGAVGVGAVWSATGGAGARRTARAATRAEAEAALDEHAASLRELLANDGVTDGDRWVDVSTEPNAHATLGSGREGAAYLAGDGVPDEVVSVTDVDAGTLAVTVRPATGRAYALLDHGDGLRLYDPEVGVRDVGTASCSTCSDDPCSSDTYDYYEYYDIDCDGLYEARDCAC